MVRKRAAFVFTLVTLLVFMTSVATITPAAKVAPRQKGLTPEFQEKALAAINQAHELYLKKLGQINERNKLKRLTNEEAQEQISKAQEEVAYEIPHVSFHSRKTNPPPSTSPNINFGDQTCSRLGSGRGVSPIEPGCFYISTSYWCEIPSELMLMEFIAVCYDWECPDDPSYITTPPYCLVYL